MSESIKSEPTKSEGSPKALALAATLFALTGCGENEEMKAELSAPFTDEELEEVCEEKGTREESLCIRIVAVNNLKLHRKCLEYGEEIRNRCLTELQRGQTSGSLNCVALQELCHRRVGKIQAARRTQLTPSYMYSQCKTGHSAPVKRGK